MASGKQYRSDGSATWKTDDVEAPLLPPRSGYISPLPFPAFSCPSEGGGCFGVLVSFPPSSSLALTILTVPSFSPFLYFSPPLFLHFLHSTCSVHAMGRGGRGVEKGAELG